MRAENEFLVDGRRAELADFFRRRRAELTPEMVGLPATQRRRTPGLRREEVAELAQISTALYAWLEQGRDVAISRRTIDAIASALALTASERDHVQTLVTPAIATVNEEISPALERMVGSHEHHPMFVLDHKWDVVLTNRVAHVVFAHDDANASIVNVLESTFDEVGRARFANWSEVAQCLVELFRFDYAAYAHEADSLALVERLRATDPDFAAIWEVHRVRRGGSAICELHSAAGVLSLEPFIVAVVESPGLRCLMFTPSDAECAQRIDTLVKNKPRLPDGRLLPAIIRETDRIAGLRIRSLDTTLGRPAVSRER